MRRQNPRLESLCSPFEELTRNTRSNRFQLTLIELHLGKDGTGEGKMVPAARISWNTRTQTIEIQNYANLPVTLTNVSTDKP